MPNVYHPLVLSRPAGRETKLPIALSHEARVWSVAKKIASHDFPHPISDLSFSPARPFDLAVAYGSSVSLISQRAGSIKKSFTRFRDVVYSPRFKHDGRLLVAGSNDAQIKLFDVKSRSPLRTFPGHKGAVQSTLFSSDGLHVISGSDDSTVRVWDIAEGKSLYSLTDATDYVRCQNHSPASRHVWITGSHDNRARLYDLRSGKCIFTLDHRNRVDDVHILPGGALVITVGGSDVRMWDLFSGGTVKNVLSCHAKAVTSAVVDSRNDRLMTAGLDGYVKVHDLHTFETKGVMSMDSPVLSLDLAADSQSFAVGLADGVVDIRVTKHTSNLMTHDEDDMDERAIQEEDEDDLLGWGRGFRRTDQLKQFNHGSRRYFNRGADVKPSEGDVIVVEKKRTGIGRLSGLLLKFEHLKALQMAIAKSSVDGVLAVSEELLNRDRLVSTISGLGMKEVSALLKLARREISSEDHSKQMTLLVNLLLDAHGECIPDHEDSLKAMKDLLGTVQREIHLEKQLESLHGGAEMMLSVCDNMASDYQ